ncbi:class II aldolase/adducin family protein [Trueperella sp. LYQ143]|uniref:class II aldolase/adducin family protein n=1 Tax=Trueperella sp. LYQ143 TaxID=3391059 RepID=UPI0039836436
MASCDVDVLIDSMISIGKKAVESGLVLGSGGNISVRHPQRRNSFIVTKSGTWFDALTPDSFCEVELGCDGWPTGNPSSEWKLHERTYVARPDVNAVIHLHPQYAVLLSAIGKKIRFFTLDDALYVKSYGQVPYAPNASDELAESAAAAAQQHNCVILEHHGCSCLGDDLAMAYRRACLLEQAAKNTYRALLLGDTTSHFPEGVELIHK